MKKIIVIAAALLMTASVWAQAPEKMSYQAVVRNSSNALVTSTAVGMQISVLQGGATGSAVYVETQTPSTNANGLVSLEIGAGTVVSGDFTAIDWANGSYFIKTETDPTGGTSYTITGTSQLMSVPYALYAKTAENITGPINYTETDPIFGVSVANGITAIDTANWNTHTVDTDTQLDSIGIAALGYVARTYYLGEELDGGIIYHLYIGSDGLQHGLIVNTTEITGEWQAIGTITNAIRSWDGVYNNALIPVAGSTAATYVAGLGAGWYLPSIDELSFLWQNRYFVNKALNSIPGTTLLSKITLYWSSTEFNSTKAFYCNFISGDASFYNKSSTYSVRAIRAF